MSVYKSGEDLSLWKAKDVKESISPQQFHTMVHEYSGYVYTITFRLLGNSADAEDAVQETFLKAFKRFHTFDKKRGLKNWLCTIALNTARDSWRKSGRQPETTETESESIADRDDHSSRTGARIDIERMLSVLDINYRSVMILHYMEQYTTREISTMLKKSESAVKIWLFRARKILMEKFGESAV